MENTAVHQVVYSNDNYLKMHSCFDCFVVYGWSEEREDMCIDPEWLASVGLSLYADSVIRAHMCTAIYGIEAHMSIEGIVTIDPADKARVDAAYAKHLEQWPAASQLGYRLGMMGDIEHNQKLYYSRLHDNTPSSDDGCGSGD